MPALSCRALALPLAVVLAQLMLLPAQAGDTLIPMTPAQAQALRISTTPLTAHAGAVSVDLPARVVLPPAQERVVAAPVAGLVSQVRVAVGDSVRAGQTLAVLRGADLVGAQRDLAQAAVQARLAEEALHRDEALFKEGIIPESRLQAARANRAQIAAQIHERRAWLRLMGLGASAIRAAERGEALADSIALASPMAGVVLEQQAMAGARVESATPLFKLARMDPLWLEIQAPAELAARLKPGQPVGVPGVAGGTVVSVGQAVSAAQTVPVRARVNNRDGQLRLNQGVSARIEGVAGSRQWRVPVRAIVRQAGRNWVFVARPGGFEPEAVQVLSQTAESAAISAATGSRFTGAEKVVIEGVAALKAAWQGE